MSRKKKQPFLSIIIPAFNTHKFYKSCLTSLLEINYPNYEILVVDDGSTDGSFEAIKKMAEKNKRLRVIQTLKRKGIPGSRNLGIEAAKGDLIAFFDMDMEVTDTWPNELIKVLLSRKKNGAVIPKVFDFHKRDIFQSVGGRIIPQTPGPLVRGLGEKDRGQYNKPEKVSINAAGAIIKKEVARELRGYDETLGMYDDIDFGWRMWIHGWESWYVPQAYIYHWTAKPWSERPGASKIMHEYYLDNFIRVGLKNFERQNVWRYLPQALAITMVRIMVNLLHGNFVPLVGASKALVVNIFRLPRTLKERAEVQKNRRVSDKKLMGSAFVKGSYLKIYRDHIRASLAKSRFWHEKTLPVKTGWQLELQLLLVKLEKLLTGQKERKDKIIRDYQRRFDIDVFIETGTYAGDMVAKLKNNFKKIISIEINKSLAQRARRKFSHKGNVRIIQGDSAEILKKELPKINKPAIFWLDAHCSGGVTSMGDLETPVKQELELILKHKIKDHVILLDDVDLFVGTHDYPTLIEVERMVQKHAPNYRLQKKNNILCLVN